MRQRRRMVLSRRALSLFPGFRRSRIYSVAIDVVPINTLEEARSRAPHFYPVKTNNFITSVEAGSEPRACLFTRPFRDMRRSREHRSRMRASRSL